MIGNLIKVSISEQTLELIEEGQVLRSYSISTAKNGTGEKSGSGCTPRGRHIIRAKIGDGLAVNSVLVGRRPTGEVYSQELAEQYPDRDWILSRIMWLSGKDVGKNRLGQCDSMQRYIYIHGTPDSEPMGVALSHGCVRMRNDDVIELFDLVNPGIDVLIEE